jgi:hypothetical protein
MERHVPVSQRILMQLPMSLPASGHPFRDEVPAPTPRGVLFPRNGETEASERALNGGLADAGEDTCQGYVFVVFMRRIFSTEFLRHYYRNCGRESSSASHVISLTRFTVSYTKEHFCKSLNFPCVKGIVYKKSMKIHSYITGEENLV